MSTHEANKMRRKKAAERGLDRPAHWRQIVRLDRWGRTRRGRRIGLTCCALLTGVAWWMTMYTLHRARWPEEALTITVFPLLLLCFGVRGMWLAFDEPGLEDQALVQFGEELDRLVPQEIEAVFRELNRRFVRGGEVPDERAKERRMQAESAAYRLLRWTLPMMVATYWAVCFFVVGASGAGHGELVMGAVAVSWCAFGVLALPAAIRMWTEPDEVGESRVLTMEREA